METITKIATIIALALVIYYAIQAGEALSRLF